ncbi:hypothetical protein GCK72_019621 [Caenorhabditis remanei]|uniref:G-protein coupled receptors family 1 profile domain-containing protein n=1 Tax=Caenorhabditis remanei TaxID=31234 RepID=A0A6A5GEF9_CAERE|nr:hypothetical protein GCK72_019621 [Caenorhabditis remanei]KAF1753065.1 hypothetical protein GCK72_019621 [Caenorhabditis remanei]
MVVPPIPVDDDYNYDLTSAELDDLYNFDDSNYDPSDYSILDDYPELDYSTINILEDSVTVNVNLQALALLFNIFHFIILTRKPLRSNAIFMYMIAICLSDILNFSLCNYDPYLPYTLTAIPRKTVIDDETYYCLKTKWEAINAEGQILSTLFEITKRLSIWLSIIMSFIRTIAVIFPMSDRVQNVATVKWTLIIILIVMVIWIIFHTWFIFWFLRIHWLPDVMPKNVCPPQPKNEIDRYVVVAPLALDEKLSKYLNIPEIILKFLPFIIYPILTIALLIQIHSYKKKRQKSVSTEKKSDNTSKLVLFMTITFMLSEGLGGVDAIIQYTLLFWMKLNMKNNNLLAYIEICRNQYPLLRTINILSHCIVCLLMSAQYRDATKSLFCCCKKEEPWKSAGTVVRKSTSVSKTSLGAVG